MRLAIEMPKASYEMEVGVIRAWHKQAGSLVVKGETVAVIETEKALVDIESPATGTLVEIVHGPGEEVPARTPMAWLEIDERSS
jgi:pyruvate dehydrogenase E2 component (dihydrolipoamide acetyltransferase)